MISSQTQPLGLRADGRTVLLERAEELTGCGSWLWQPETGEILWSDNLYRIFDLDRDQAPTLELVLARTHPQDRAAFSRHIDAAAESGTMDLVDFRVVHTDGTVRHVRALGRVDLTEHGEPGLLLGAVQDLTDTCTADREIAAYVAVSEALTDPDGLGAGGEALVARLAGALDFCVGAVWLPDRSGVLMRHGVWHSDSAPDPVGLPPGAAVPLGRGLVGCAAAERRPVALRNMPERLRSADTLAAVRAGLHGGLAIPALTEDEVIAVIELRSVEPEYVPERLASALVALSRQLGAFLARRRGELTPSVLTAREIEILQLAAGGLSGPQIAAQLVISPATVKSHLEHIYAKLGVPDRAAAVACGFRDGIIK